MRKDEMSGAEVVEARGRGAFGSTGVRLIAAVTVALLVAVGLGLATVPAGAEEVVVARKNNILVYEDMPGSGRQYVDTGLEVRDGDRVRILATGTVEPAPFWSTTGPDGYPRSDCQPNSNYPHFAPRSSGDFTPRCFALTGKLNGHHFWVGRSHDGTHFRGTDTLKLIVNDDAPGGGSGHFAVNVEVLRDVPLSSGGFEWEMEPRFGKDANGDGVTDYHWNETTASYAQSYVNPSGFKVNFNGCPTAEEYSSAGTVNSELYTWDYGDGVKETIRNCRPSHTYARQGSYGVKLNDAPAKQIRVRDLLIVSLGDSYGSGEGAPDVPISTYKGWGLFGWTVPGDNLRYGTWPNAEAKWVDKRCHRSAWAGAAQAARALEESDPHSSVTFISFACSGATISRETTFDGNKPQGSGVLGPYRGIEPPPGPSGDPNRELRANWLPPQIDALARTLAGCAPTDSTCTNRPGRRIDSLVISGGGNDAYFADVVSNCVTEKFCNSHEATIAMKDSGLAELPARYDALANAIHAANPSGRPALDVGKVYLTEYPDPTRGDDGETCETMMDTIGSALNMKIVRVESDWVREAFHGPLNETMKNAAERNTGRNWEYVDGVSSRYSHNGYCARDHWIVHPMESRMNQGPYRSLPFESWEHTDVLQAQKGMMHPNVMGFRAYSDALFPRLQAQFSQTSDGMPPSFTASSEVPGAASRHGENGWITGATGANSTEIPAGVFTVAAEDPSGISSGVATVNGRANACPATGAMECSVVDMSGQRKEWRFRISEEGIHRFEFSVRGSDGQIATYVHEVRVDLRDPEAMARASRPPDENGRYTAPVDVTLDGSDAVGGSGVYKVEYTVGGGPVKELESGGKVTLQPDETRLRYWSVDVAGRKSAVRDFIARDRIAFLSDREGGVEQIWATDTDGAFPTRITNVTAAEGDRAPAFSPDGKKIAFASLRAGPEDYEIYIANADGSNPVRLTDNAAEDRATAFSPDGKKIVFSSNRDGNWEIYSMNTDGSGQTRLTNNPATDTIPAFSPDGRKIIFESNRDGNNEIYVMNADGANPVRLTNHPADDRSPVFSPDGRKIAFASTRDVFSNHEIYVANADGSNPVRLTSNLRIDISPAFSPDGSKIAFASFRDGNYEVYVMNADGSNQTNITRNPAADFQPDWGLVYNDAFTESRAIHGSSATVAGSTLAATREGGEPVHSPNEGGFTWSGDHSVWYRWTAPKSGAVVVDTCDTNFDTLLSAYTGGSIGTLKRVADNNNHADCGGSWGSKMTFEAEAGTVYNIAVSGAGGARAGIFTLKMSLAPDTTAPETILDPSGPNGTVNTRSASFDFDSNESGAFLCSLDGAPFSDCGDSPKIYSDLPEGERNFRVKAVDRAGNEDATPASRTWIIDATAPQTRVTSGPSGLVRSASATFGWSGSDDRTPISDLLYSYKLDGGEWSEYSSDTRVTLSGLSQGAHTIHVRAKDAAGNVDESPATRSFTVDTVVPAGGVKINTGAARTTSLRVTLNLTASDSGSGVSQMCISNTTRCTAWQPFARSKAWKLAGNKAGTKTVYVRYKDRAGNASALYRDTIRYVPRR